MVDLAGENGVVQRLNHVTEVLPGRGVQPVFGQRLAVAGGIEADVWRGAALRRPLPLAPKPMSIVSTSATDLYPSTGAMLAVVGFVDQFGDWRMSDLLALNGTTPVQVTYKPDDGVLGDASRPPAEPSPADGSSVTAMIFRVQDALVVLAAGSTEAAPFASNIGEITVEDAGGVVFEVIPAMAGRSRTAAFHVPRRYTAVLTSAPAATERGQATIFLALNFGLGTAWQEIPISGLNDGPALFVPDGPTTRLVERTDIQGRFRAETNNIDIMWLFFFRLQRVA